MFFSIIFCLVLAEGVFMFVPRSHGNGASYGAILWYRFHWGEINENGYRDRKINITEESSLKKVLVMGDSLAAGVGIDRQDERFSGGIQKALGAGARVFNAGVPGSNTQDEYQRVINFPVSPDLLILQYYGNDIADSASFYDANEKSEDWEKIKDRINKKAGEADKQSHAAKMLGRLTRNKLINACSSRSFLCNYIYWRGPQDSATSYITHLMSLYASQKVMDAHKADLLNFVKYSKEKNIPFIVIVFPFLQDPDLSEYYTAKITSFFRDNGVVAIDLSDAVKTLPPDERVVNSNDGHPSVKVHKIAADALYKAITETGKF
jgi:hypothetical protein